MPIILPPEAGDFWLDPDVTEPERLPPALVPYPAEKIQATPVSCLVNNPRVDDPLILKSVRE
jgi:putative SOS response-associated peptidase YedK